MIHHTKPLKVLLIGGTGTISTPICERLSQDKDVTLYVLNRGSKSLPKGAYQIIGDVNDTIALNQVLSKYQFDVVCNFIIFKPQQALQQIDLFKDKIKQYIMISTVATYDHENSVMINELHSQNNIYSQYGQEKTKCENIFMNAHKEFGFPITIVRPSQTYGYDRIPLSVKGKSCYSVISRILNDKPVIVHGDGKSIWHCTHTNDFAHNFIGLINNEKTIGQSYHIINPMIVNWDMIYHYLYKLLGKEPNIVHIPSDLLAMSKTYDNVSAFLGDKQYSCYYDMTKLANDIKDFKNEIDIIQGLKMYLVYIEKHPEARNEDEDYDQWCNTLIGEYQDFLLDIKEKI